MFKWFRRCEHKWKRADQWEIVSNLTGYTIGKLVELQCEKCGDVKQQRITL